MCIVGLSFAKKPCATQVFIVDPIGYTVCALHSLCYTAYEYDAQGATHCHQSLLQKIRCSMATTSLFYANISRVRALTLSTLTRRLIQAEIITCCLKMSTARKAKRRSPPLRIPGTGIWTLRLP